MVDEVKVEVEESASPVDDVKVVMEEADTQDTEVDRDSLGPGTGSTGTGASSPSPAGDLLRFSSTSP